MVLPKLKSEIAFYETSESEVFYVYDPVLDKHYKMGTREVSWLKLCDGSTSEEELYQKVERECSRDLFQTFLETVAKMGLLENEGQELRKKFNLFQMKIRLAKPNEWLNRHIKWVKFFAFLIKLLAIPLIAFGGYYTWKEFLPLALVVQSPHVGWEFIPVYLIAFFIIMLIHESSHAVMAKSYNAAVPSAGLMLFYFQPAAYVDLSGIWLLPNLRQKVMTLLAGIISQFMLSSVIIICFHFFGDIGALFWRYMLLIYTANIVVALANLIPFVKLDGYFVTCVVLDLPGLREKSLQFLGNALKGKGEKLAGDMKAVYVGYGIFALIYTPVVLLSGVQFIRALFKHIVSYNVLNMITVSLSILILAWPFRRWISKGLARRSRKVESA